MDFHHRAQTSYGQLALAQRPPVIQVITCLSDRYGNNSQGCLLMDGGVDMMVVVLKCAFYV